jgi:pyridoxal 5'-phosphate synthase pdxT subunit
LVSGPTVGVLALQGAFAEHRAVFEGLGAATREIRRPDQLDGVDGLVLPGGESTTMAMLLDSSGLHGPLAAAVAAGLPVFGTCAGMILLAREVLDGRADQWSLDAIDLAVRRNGYGRQLASFEAPIDVTGLDSPFPAVFIRAPLVEKAGDDVEVLGEVTGPDGRPSPALCRAGSVMVSAFHPELSGDDRVHRLFLGMMDGTEREVGE